MISPALLYARLPAFVRAPLHALAVTWQVMMLGAQLAVLTLTPAVWRSASVREATLRQIHDAAWYALPGFTALMTLLSLVLIHIVMVTAHSYGLTPYALETMVRMLVLELLPLAAALFIAISYSVPEGNTLFRLRRDGALAQLRAAGGEPLVQFVLPRALGAGFAVVLLALISALVALVLSYAAVHGFTLAGLSSYNHAVGTIFSRIVVAILVVKTAAFAMAVALMPLAGALRDAPKRATRTSVELRGLVRMAAFMLLIEIASLVGNYY
ncbi:MAG: ABC transporter permease [Ottowia sp.]|nr:ABC transporter permease [Ottowia sp.]